MKSCLRIPRLFLPEEGFETWCVVPEKEGSEGAAGCLFRGGSADAELLAKLRENMFSALTEGTISRLYRGMVLVKRTYALGVRKGLLAACDLEEYAPQGSKTAMIRATSETDPALVQELAKVRAASPLEIPHAVLCYRDKKAKILRALEEEELEKLYDFSPRAEERLEGFFIPDYISAEVIEDLCRYADPCFGVLDGDHALAAAKLRWEELKKEISEREALNHPARFFLAEFVDLSDPAVSVEREGCLMKKEELLSLWKTGKRLPAHSLRLTAPRFPMEAREISYD